MFTSSVRALCIASVLMLLAGCGKSAEFKKLEADLNERIIKGHEAQMAKIPQLDTLLAQLNNALTPFEARGTAAQDAPALLSARDHLQASKEAMESWMSNYQPYNEGTRHDIAMAQLQSTLNSLEQIGRQLDTGLAETAAALDAWHQSHSGK